jgi:hypothetical protein
MTLSTEEFLSSSISTEVAISTATDQAAATSKKSYRDAYIYLNVTSNSQQDNLHSCPRFWRIEKFPIVSTVKLFEDNVDFAYGHSVGAGIQTYLSTKNKQAALWAAFLSWNADHAAEHVKKCKSLDFAFLATIKFINFWQENWANDWELAWFQGKPATEYTFLLDTENGFFHAGHIDAILRHRISGHFMVLEIKTTSKKIPDEAAYGNSGQGLGYSIVLDQLVENLDESNRYEVLYLVYSSTVREFTPFIFTKTRTQRIEWLQDLLLDHTSINTYHKLNFFPKRGNSCVNFNRRCKYYGLCDMSSQGFGVAIDTPDHKWYIPGVSPEPEMFDFKFKLSDFTSGIVKQVKKESQENETK